MLEANSGGNSLPSPSADNQSNHYMLYFKGEKNRSVWWWGLLFILIGFWNFPIRFGILLCAYVLIYSLVSEKIFGISKGEISITYDNILSFIKYRYCWNDIQKITFYPSSYHVPETLVIYFKNDRVRTFWLPYFKEKKDFILALQKYTKVVVVKNK